MANDKGVSTKGKKLREILLENKGSGIPGGLIGGGRIGPQFQTLSALSYWQQFNCGLVREFGLSYKAISEGLGGRSLGWNEDTVEAHIGRLCDAGLIGKQLWLHGNLIWIVNPVKEFKPWMVKNQTHQTKKCPVCSAAREMPVQNEQTLISFPDSMTA